MTRSGFQTKELINYKDKNLILNCPVTRQDILRAEDIFGPNLGDVKNEKWHVHVGGMRGEE